MELRDNITTIKGIGDKTAASFAKLGIHTVDDLIHTYPRNYLTYGALVDIKDAVIGERCAVCAIISSYVDVRQVRSLKLTNMTVKDSTGSLKLTWFNSHFLKMCSIRVKPMSLWEQLRLRIICELWRCRSIISFLFMRV